MLTRKTTGDKILDRPLEKIGGKGLFVKELDQALPLRGGGPDGAQQQRPAHGAGPPASPGGLLPPGGPPGRAGAAQGRLRLDPGLPVGCSSPRRRAQLGLLFPGQPVPRCGGTSSPAWKSWTGGSSPPWCWPPRLKAPGAGAPDQPDLLPGGDAPRRGQGILAGAGPPGL